MSFPLDILTESITEEDEPTHASDYIRNLEDRLRKSHNIAREHLKLSAERQRRLYNANVKSMDYKVGDMVWRNQKKNTPGLKLKISRQWTGPWVITEKLSDVVFKIKHSKNSPTVIIHGDNLKPYKGNKTAKWFKGSTVSKTPVTLPSLHEFSEANLPDDRSKEDQNDGQDVYKHNGDNQSVINQGNDNTTSETNPDEDLIISPDVTAGENYREVETNNYRSPETG